MLETYDASTCHIKARKIVPGMPRDGSYTFLECPPNIPEDSFPLSFSLSCRPVTLGARYTAALHGRRYDEKNKITFFEGGSKLDLLALVGGNYLTSYREHVAIED